jgi:hypothetical protein
LTQDKDSDLQLAVRTIATFNSYGARVEAFWEPERSNAHLSDRNIMIDLESRPARLPGMGQETSSKQILLQLLSDSELSVATEIAALDSVQLANIFVDAAFFSNAMKFLTDENWLQRKNQQLATSFKDFVGPFFAVELSPVLFFQAFLESSSLAEMKSLSDKALRFESAAINLICSRPALEQKIFATQALQLMSKLFEFENQTQLNRKAHGLPIGLSMYRTFDNLDKLFRLNYEADHGMKTDLARNERLYEGAGVGVQSGYSTVLTALRYLDPANGARIIDLGSGYGRVGLIVGLLRPDIDFIGYEYVPHRVDIASSSTESFGLQEHVHFYTQDLSLKEFQIPEADIYYMYDPFSDETYGHVLSQLVEMSRHRRITIVTKGNARAWLLEAARREGWSEAEEFDSGNLCLFHS